MRKAIESFPDQFSYVPEIENPGHLNNVGHYLVVGMGGSHLAADLLRGSRLGARIKVWSDYGLPELSPDEMKNTLVVASSYSGNTEEVLDAAEMALKKKIGLAVITVGGKLLEFAKAHQLPYIQIPKTSIQPRMALGFMTRALLKMMGEEQELRTLEQLKNTLKSSELESLGKTIAKKLQEKVPVIYASRTNEALAYNWKIKCNETGKIPAYWNVFPELNHNEMTGFDETPETKGLSEQFHFLFLEDPDDDPRIQKRMKITKDLCQKRNLAVESVPLGEGGFWEKTFRSLILADWIAYHLSAFYGTEAEQVPMVEEFKRLIA